MDYAKRSRFFVFNCMVPIFHSIGLNMVYIFHEAVWIQPEIGHHFTTLARGGGDGGVPVSGFAYGSFYSLSCIAGENDCIVPGHDKCLYKHGRHGHYQQWYLWNHLDLSDGVLLHLEKSGMQANAVNSEWSCNYVSDLVFVVIGEGINLQS